ncbi:interleukin-1 receptor type 2 isoform X2 [Lampris incognitus]|uniref:interleukin-1 receptor type 2 isoform X2 n=1 Tax=Lampris incognitus TaxID=2546036 RepID=UPI0024B493EA|nr:interleukin-1 receptor type 2 isoform X2 [Lampris incognitus]
MQRGLHCHYLWLSSPLYQQHHRGHLCHDGCFQVQEEVELFRVEGEAVILAFPSFHRVLQRRSLASPTAKYLIAKSNWLGDVTYAEEGRVQQRGEQLWLLPAQASDTGEYTCFFRNDTYCIAGSITLRVYESGSVDMDKLSYTVSTTLGHSMTIKCPSLGRFNQTDQIDWYKEPSPMALQLGTGSYYRDRDDLLILDVKRSHQGLYTCQVRVRINNQQYKVKRTVQLHVQEPLNPTPRPASDLSITFDPILNGRTSGNAADTRTFLPPVIVFPLNGTIFESTHGSVLKLLCKVFTECQMANSTAIMWLVNGQSVESSYLIGRALQGRKRVTRTPGSCQVELMLVVMELSEVDSRAEWKCVTQNQGGEQDVLGQLRLEDSTFIWLVAAIMVLSCVLSVLSVCLYVLLKPRRKTDYFLTKQNSIC